MTGPGPARAGVLAVGAAVLLSACSGPAARIALPVPAGTSGPATTVLTSAPPSRSTVVSAPATPAAAVPPRAGRAPGATLVINAAGAVLPDPVRTPGATDPRVTPATIHSTICVPGYTKSVRPPSTYTGRVKRAQLAAGYRYRGDSNPADYEEDHLISLELGGAPRAVANLWPEPYLAPQGARSKDRLENALHSLVCSGLISLGTAQRAIARNWWVAAALYAAPTRARAATAPRPSTPRPAPSPVSPAAPNCTPGYRPCIPAGTTDVDCAGGSGNGPRYVTGPVEVTGADPYGLDPNHDGIGCASG